MPTMGPGGKMYGDNGEPSRVPNGNGAYGGRSPQQYPADPDVDNPDGNIALSEQRKYRWDKTAADDTNQAKRDERYARGWWTSMENGSGGNSRSRRK